MNPDTLLRQFDVIADAPNGVRNLRELIVQLAVRGKLVPQDPSDEPASVLLERIQVEKERHGGRPKPLPLTASEEMPFEAPEGWEWVKFGNAIELVSGQHLSPTEYNEQGEGLPYYTGPADFGERSPTASRWTYEKRAVARRDDVLLTVKGAGIGKTNILVDPEAAISRQLMAIRPVLINPAYTSLVAQAATNQLREEQVGIAIPGIGRNDVLNLLIVLPPLPEQRRIVEKVDQLMALCDELEERQQRRTEKRVRLNRASLHHLTDATDDAELTEHWQRVRENFHLLYDAPETVTELRQAILQLAVRGKLVPQDPNDEPATGLLARIEAERKRLHKAGEIRKPKSLPSVDADEVLFELPDGWAWVRLGSATVWPLTDGDWVESKDQDPQGDVRLVQLADVGEGFYRDRSDRFLTSETADRLNCTILSVGDVLIARLPNPLGRACLFPGDQRPCATVVDVAIARCGDNGPLPRYIMTAINSGLVREQIYAFGTGTTRFRVSTGNLSTIVIPFPPLAEQRRIVEKVDQLIALCDGLEVKLTRSRDKAERLASAVVHHLTAR